MLGAEQLAEVLWSIVASGCFGCVCISEQTVSQQAFSLLFRLMYGARNIKNAVCFRFGLRCMRLLGKMMGL